MKNTIINAKYMILAIVVLASMIPTISVNAQDNEKIGEVTKLPIPRFVSLKANAVNLRVGPGTEYSIIWLYTKKGLPVEIIQEYDRWRRIRTVDGTTGWVLHSLLSARRTGFVAPWESVKNENGEVIKTTMHEGRKRANQQANVKTKMQSGLMVKVLQCKEDWCLVEAEDNKSWMKQEKLWGTYPGEEFKK